MRTLIVLAVLVVAVCYANPTEGGKKVMTDAPGASAQHSRGSGPPPVRTKRNSVCGVASKMASSDKTNVLNDHNVKRKKASAKAADMMKMTWSDALANRAQEWAEQCTWAHGMSNMCDETVKLGQNMYMISGASLDIDEAMNAWYNEVFDYDYELNLCSDGAICGHYTQLVWSESHEVGCGIAHCDSVAVGSGTWENAMILVCDYWPTGNWVGEQPYKAGDQCSKCSSALTDSGIAAGFTCDEGLCKPCLPSVDANCVCDDSSSATCAANGGTWDSGLCRCICAAGFYGQVCDKSCECVDSGEYAAYCAAWGAGGLCTDDTYKAFMTSACPATCSLCGATPAECS